MACDILYKGKRYTEQEFDDLLQDQDFLEKLEISLITDGYLDSLIDDNVNSSDILDGIEKSGQIPAGLNKVTLHKEIMAEIARRNDAGVGPVTLEVTVTKLSKLLSKTRLGGLLARFDQKYLNGIKNLRGGRKLYDKNIQRHGEVERIKREVSKQTKALNNVIRKYKSKLTPADHRAIMNLLKGGNVTSLSLAKIDPAKRDAVREEIRKITADFRSLTDALSKQVIQSGFLSEFSLDTVRDNLGNYVTRAYSIHLEPDVWWDKLTTDPLLAGVFSKGVGEIKNMLNKKLEKARNRKTTLEKAIAEQEANRAIGPIDGTLLDARKKRLRKVEQTIRDTETLLTDDKALQLYIQAEFNVGQEKDPVAQPKSTASKKTTDKSIFKNRESLPKALREFMGEVTDPLLAMELTAAKLAEFTTKYNFHTQMAAIGNNILFKTTPEGDFTQKVSISTAPGLVDALGTDFIYTNKAFKEYLQGDLVGFGQQKSGLTYPILATISSWTKGNLTVGSVPTQIRNVVGAFLFLVRSGNLLSKHGLNTLKDLTLETGARLGESGSSAINKAFKTTLNPQRSKRLEDVLQIAIGNGVVNSSVTLREIEEIGRKSLSAKVGKWVNKKTGKLSKFLTGPDYSPIAAITLMKDVYAASDDIFKVAALSTELNRYSDALFNKTFEQVKADYESGIISKQDYDALIQRATAIVRDTIPNYNETWEIVNKLNSNFFIGTFISFQAEQMRTLWNISKIARQEIDDGIASGNKKLMWAGAERIIGLTANLALTVTAGTLLTKLTKSLFGGDEVEDEANAFVVKYLTSDFIKTASISQIQPGKFVISDPSSFFPDLAIVNAFRGGGPKNADNNGVAYFLQSILPVLDPAITRDIGLNELNNIANNRDQNGNKISIEKPFTQAWVADIMNATLRTPLSPTPLKKALKDKDAVSQIAALHLEIRTELGNSPDGSAKLDVLLAKQQRLEHKLSENEIFFRAFYRGSFKTTQIDIKEASRYKAYGYTDKSRAIKSNLTKKMKLEGTDKAAHIKLFNEAKTSHRKNLNEMRELYRGGMKHFGVDVSPYLKVPGFSKIDLKYITGLGGYPRYEPSGPTALYGKNAYKTGFNPL